MDGGVHGGKELLKRYMPLRPNSQRRVMLASAKAWWRSAAPLVFSAAIWGPCCGAAETLPNSLPPSVPFNKEFDAYLHKEQDTLSSSGIVRTITVDPYVNQQIRFFFGSERGGATLQVTNPDGIVLVPDDSAGITRKATNRSESYLVKQPKTGNWSIKITPHGQTVSEHYVFAVTGQGENNLYFRLNARRVGDASGRRLLVEGAVFGPYGVKGIEMSGSITYPSGKTTALTLYDDGAAEHGDKYAGDGRYANILLDLKETGVYHLAMVAKGTLGKTVVPGDSPDFVYSVGSPPVKSQAVPAFERHTDLEVKIE